MVRYLVLDVSNLAALRTKAIKYNANYAGSTIQEPQGRLTQHGSYLGLVETDSLLVMWVCRSNDIKTDETELLQLRFWDYNDMETAGRGKGQKGWVYVYKHWAPGFATWEVLKKIDELNKTNKRHYRDPLSDKCPWDELANNKGKVSTAEDREQRHQNRARKNFSIQGEKWIRCNEVQSVRVWLKEMAPNEDGSIWSKTFFEEMMNALLWKAVDYEKCEIIELLLQEGADIHSQPGDQWKVHFGEDCQLTVMMIACKKGSLYVVEQLLKHASTQRIDLGVSPMKAAVEYGHIDVLEAFIEHGKTLDPELLSAAAEHDQQEMAKYLIKQELFTNYQPLEAAVLAGNFEMAEYLMKTAKNKKQRQFPLLKEAKPLAIAIRNGKIDLAKYLMKIGCVVDKTPAEAAVEMGNGGILEELKKHGACKDFIMDHGDDNLEWAIKNGNFSSVDMLLKQGAKLPDEFDYSDALREACKAGKPDVIPFLIENGAEVVASLNGQKSPIQYCLTPAPQRTYEKCLECLNLLLKGLKGSDSLQTGVEAVILKAVKLGNAELLQKVKKMVSKSVFSRAMNNGKKNPLVAAVDSGNIEMFQALIYAGAKVEEADSKVSLVHRAFEKEQLHMLEYLVQKESVDVNRFNKDGLTTLMVLCAEPKTKQFQKYFDAILKAKGAKIGLASERTGETALMKAASSLSLEFVQALLNKNKRNIKRKDANGWTALMHAAKRRGQFVGIVQELYDNGANLDIKNLKETKFDNLAVKKEAKLEWLKHASKDASPIIEKLFRKRKRGSC